LLSQLLDIAYGTFIQTLLLLKQVIVSNRLNFADVLKMERYPLFGFFLFLGQKLTIVEESCTLQGHSSLTHLPCSDCQIPKLFTKLCRILL